MRFIYGMESARDLEFDVAFEREAVPEGAEVYAVCDDALTLHQLNEETFARMTDEEYFMLRALITESERAEASGAFVVSFKDAGLLRRLVRRMLGPG
ncbi:MAG TPA: hypothetical protein VM095_15660 [Pyrinomonadaceae bacterium]|nr:hypothetical protein [Pyrinomonadaceae bacterium]